MSEQTQTTTQARYYGEKQKKYYNDHKEKRSNIMKAYYLANADRIKQRRRERYARQKTEKLTAQTAE